MSTFQSKSSINSYCIGRATKRLHNEYKKFMESPPENITVAFQEDLILRWHFLFSGLNGTLFDGGEYHGVLMFPQDYPFSPPSIQFITPNGRFKTGERVCFALSEFHPEYWKPAYTVSAVLQGVYRFMMSETTDTVGSLDVDESEIKELAGKSREFNLQDGCTDLFQDEMKAALSDDSNVDTDTPLPQKSRKKEKLAAKSSSGKDKLDKYKSTRKFKSEANYQFSSKSLSQSDQINTKSSEMLKGSKLVNSSLTSKFSKSPFNLK